MDYTQNRARPSMPWSSIGSPADPATVVNRNTETSALVSKMLTKKINYNIALVGHRGIGKTTILRRAMHELAAHDNVAVAYFDVRENLTEPRRFLATLERAILDAYMSAKRSGRGSMATGRDRALRLANRAVAALLSRRIKSVELGISGEGAVTPRLVVDEARPDYGQLLVSVLQSASALAERDRLKFVVMIDEFQDLAALSRYPGLGDVLALFRSAVQGRGPNVSFVVGSSRVRLSEAVLGGARSPLFGHFCMQPVGELDRASSALLFKKCLRTRGQPGSRAGGPPAAAAARAAAAAHELVGGHPYYLMALAGAWDGSEDVKSTYGRSLEPPLGLLHLYCEYVLSEDVGSAVKSPLSRAILEAAAVGGGDDGCGIRSYSAMAKALSYRIERLPRYVRPLVDADLLDDGSGFAVRDPVLRDYLRACVARRGASGGPPAPG